jgi:hypothetical protein
MRNPILLENAQFRIRHDSDLDLDRNECESCSSEYSEHKSHTFFITQDIDITRPNPDIITSKSLRWALDVNIKNREVEFEISKIPDSNDDLYKDIQNSIVQKVSNMVDSDISTDETTTDISVSETADMIHPIIDRELFVEILLEIGFEQDKNQFSRKDIGKLSIDNDFCVRFDRSFDIERFNKELVSEFEKKGRRWYGDLSNPYEDVFTLESIAPFFSKHEEKASHFWEIYSSRIFKNNPLTQKDRILDCLIEGLDDRFEYLELWIDLIKSIDFEVFNIYNSKLRSAFKDAIYDCTAEIDREELLIPWNNDIYSEIIERNILSYNPSDFKYGQGDLQKEVRFCVPKDNNITHIYEASGYGYYGSKKSTLLPQGWLVNPIGVTVTDQEKDYDMESMYQVLEKLPDSMYVSRDEIENSKMCTKSELKPVIRNDGHHKKFQEIVEKKNTYKNRIKQSVHQGYSMETFDLSDFLSFRNENFSDGYDGWHTGTICSSFPFKASLGEREEDYESYEEFEISGAVSFKTSKKIRIKPNWESIINDTLEDLTEQEIIENIKSSNYCMDDEIVITFHNLP